MTARGAHTAAGRGVPLMNRIPPLEAFKRYWWVSLLFAFAGAALGAIPTPETSTDSSVSYSATYASLMITDDPNGLFGGGIVSQLEVFATLGEVPKRAAVRLGRSEDDGPALAGQVQVTADVAQALITISATQATPADAEALVNAFGEELATFITERQDETREDRLARLTTRRDELKTELDTLQGQLAASPDDLTVNAQAVAIGNQYTVVAQQIDTLENDTSMLVLTELQRGNAVEIRSSSGLSAPKSRSTRGMFGFALGAVVGAIIAVVLGRLDRRIRNRDHAEALFGGGASADIPLVSAKSDALDVRPERHDQLSDSYRTLRSVVAFSQAAIEDGTDRTRVTLVVSACAGDGKTSVAANLAAAMAETGKRVVVVNGDFRRPAVAKRLLDQPPATLPYALEDLTVTPVLNLMQRTSTQNVALFDLSSVKASPGNLARATSRMMPDILAISDAVVIDSSPIGLTAEVLDLLSMADTIVMVIRLGHTLAATAQRTMEMLHTLTSATIHLALMGENTSQQPYYDYSNDSRRKPTKDEA